MLSFNKKLKLEIIFVDHIFVGVYGLEVLGILPTLSKAPRYFLKVWINVSWKACGMKVFAYMIFKRANRNYLFRLKNVS